MVGTHAVVKAKIPALNLKVEGEGGSLFVATDSLVEALLREIDRFREQGALEKVLIIYKSGVATAIKDLDNFVAMKLLMHLNRVMSEFDESTLEEALAQIDERGLSAELEVMLRTNTV